MATRKLFAAIIVSALACGAALALSGCLGIWPPSLRPHKDTSFAMGTAELSDIPTSLDIDWTSGRVSVTSYDGATLQFQEVFDDREGIPQDSERMAWKVEDGTLIIEFVQPGVRYWGPPKRLTVLVPSGTVFKKATIRGTSADIDVPLLEAEKLRLYSTSGDISATLTASDLSVSTTSGDMRVVQTGSAERVSVESTSGNIFLSQQGKAADVTAETTSGSISIQVTECASVKADSTSGDIGIAIPADWGFNGRFSTTSGSFDYDLQLTKQGKIYTYGDGSHALSASATSGNISLKLK